MLGRPVEYREQHDKSHNLDCVRAVEYRLRLVRRQMTRSARMKRPLLLLVVVGRVCDRVKTCDRDFSADVAEGILLIGRIRLWDDSGLEVLDYRQVGKPKDRSFRQPQLDSCR